jgi:hypothetical protein
MTEPVSKSRNDKDLLATIEKLVREGGHGAGLKGRIGKCPV